MQPAQYVIWWFCKVLVSGEGIRLKIVCRKIVYVEIQTCSQGRYTQVQSVRYYKGVNLKVLIDLEK